MGAGGLKPSILCSFFSPWFLTRPLLPIPSDLPAARVFVGYTLFFRFARFFQNFDAALIGFLRLVFSNLRKA